jgi:hypothetical protein
VARCLAKSPGERPVAAVLASALAAYADDAAAPPLPAMAMARAGTPEPTVRARGFTPRS